VTATELIPKIYEVNYALIVSGSDLIIRQWHDFLQSLKTTDLSTLDKGQAGIQMLIMRQKLAEIIQSIRKDLGHRDKAIDVVTISDVYMPINFSQEDWVAINGALEANQALMTDK